MSSSAFTVGFLNTLYALTGRMVGKRQLASNAIYIEQDIIGEHVGSQDQVTASFGGLNRMEFNGKENFLVQPGHSGVKRLLEQIEKAIAEYNQLQSSSAESINSK